ncbi:TRAP transporter small permease subunit [Halopenitus salinus]|uniref:TRAP transporter small permease subunit n=2 Tax=Halopenitus salinus TaxID=1198295 RepID=A0ABD5V358_9EURY
MLITGLIQIFNRFIDISVGLYWVGEITRTTLVFLTLVALPYLFKHNLDISFLPILERFSNETYNVLILVRNILLIGFLVIMVQSSYLSYYQVNSITLPTIRWFYIRWIYAVMAVSFGATIVYVISDTLGKLIALASTDGVETDAGDDHV